MDSNQGEEQGGKHPDPSYKASVSQQMGAPQQQNVAQVSKELEIKIAILCAWRKTWRLQW